MHAERYVTRSSRGKQSRKKVVLFVFLGVLTAAGISRLARSYLFFPLKITSESMSPTLPGSKTVYINRTVRPADIKRGDIILVRHPLAPELVLLRRVIALPGEKVEISDRMVIIDDKPLDTGWEKEIRKNLKPTETYLPEIQFPLDNLSPRSIRPEHFFLLADNRNTAPDSRQLGQIAFRYYIGRLW